MYYLFIHFYLFLFNQIVKTCYCPTLLTRNGERIRSSGKFGGTQNSAPRIDQMQGKVFGAPLPEAYDKTGKQIGKCVMPTRGLV